MDKALLGTKRVDPETGKKFYDLGRDPVVSPYTGKSYPLSYFENIAETLVIENEVDAEDDLDSVLKEPQFIDIEESDDEENLPELEDEDEIEIDADDDSFLETSDDDDDTEVKDIIGEGFVQEDDL